MSPDILVNLSSVNETSFLGSFKYLASRSLVVFSEVEVINSRHFGCTGEVVGVFHFKIFFKVINRGLTPVLVIGFPAL